MALIRRAEVSGDPPLRGCLASWAFRPWNLSSAPQPGVRVARSPRGRSPRHSPVTNHRKPRKSGLTSRAASPSWSADAIRRTSNKTTPRADLSRRGVSRPSRERNAGLGASVAPGTQMSRPAPSPANVPGHDSLGISRRGAREPGTMSKPLSIFRHLGTTPGTGTDCASSCGVAVSNSGPAQGLRSRLTCPLRDLIPRGPEVVATVLVRRGG